MSSENHYKIISEGDKEGLEKKVNAAICAGLKTCGGPFVALNQFHQAVQDSGLPVQLGIETATVGPLQTRPGGATQKRNKR